MNRKTILIAAALLAAGPAVSFAQNDDVLKGAVDPFDSGGERTRFLAAAGVDSELDEKEFTANQSASEPFARKYDAWATLRAFDRNGNGMIDWFEAEGYRKALRDAVILAYDKSKDGKLADEERDAANKDLAAGKAPRVARPRADRPGRGDDANPRPNQPDQRGEPGERRGGLTEEQRADLLKRFDADGNGELNREELGKAREARIEEWRKNNPEEAERFDARRAEDQKRREEFTRKYDKDGNGELSDEERREAFRAEGEARLAQWKERDPEGYARFEKQRQEFTKRFDKDGNGELSDDERREGFATMRDEGRKAWEDLTKKYDKDGDGRLNREEREAIPQSERENLPNFGGRGGPGGQGDRGGRGGRGDQGGRGQGGQGRGANDL